MKQRLTLLSITFFVALLFASLVSGAPGTPIDAQRQTSTPTATVSPTATPTTTPPPFIADLSGEALFEIDSEQSEVRFILTEDLRGVFTTVTGVTDQVAGQMLVNFDDPSQSILGVVRVNVRTLATDNEFRNRAIRGQILLSAQDEYEFSDFTPETLVGLPTTLTSGEFAFQVEGTFSLRGITQPVTFDTVVTIVSPDELRGTATAVIERSDFELEIPNVPGVANVSEEVTLEIDFTAVRLPS